MARKSNVDLIKMNTKSIKEYLDSCIEHWREIQILTETEEDFVMSSHYIDAFQSVRMSLFGELLPVKRPLKIEDMRFTRFYQENK